MIVFALLACGPKIDPLTPMAAEVAKARRAGHEGTPPHLRVVLASDTMGEVLRQSIANNPIKVPVMIGTAAIIEPDLEPPVLELSQSPACACPRTSLTMRGALDIQLAGLLGSRTLADDLGFEARAVGSADLAFDRDDAGLQQLVLKPVAQDPWSITIALDEEQGMINNELVASQVSGPLVQQLAQPLVLGKIPETLPVKPAAISLEVAEDPTAVLWLQGRPSAPPPEVTVESGWAIGSTEDALTAAARATFVNAKQPKKWKLEPLAIEVGDGTWTADARLHRVARRPKFREYRFTGTLELGEEAVVAVTSAERTAKKGWGLSFTSLFVDGGVRRQALKTRIEAPTSFDQTAQGRTIRITLTDVRSEGTDVFAYGTLEPVETPPEPEEPDEAQPEDAG